jgi:hypothetical protein
VKELSAKEELIQGLLKRMGEVAEHRVARWLEELDKVTSRSAKERLVARIDELTENLAVRWLCELDERLCWLDYRQDHHEFCYGVGFDECGDCKSEDDHEVCPNYDYCKAEYEAEWPGRRD